MGTRQHKPEEIVKKLQQVEGLVCQGMARVDAIRKVAHHQADLLPLAQATSLCPPFVRGQWSSGGVKDFVHCQTDDGKAYRTLNNETLFAVGSRTMVE